MKTYTLIDSDKYSEAGIETMFFPGGEPHIKLPHKYDGQEVLVVLRIRSWQDLGFAACVVQALSLSKASIVKAFVPYFPAARQDKSDGTAPITVRLVASLFNSSNIDRISVFDCHSMRTLAELDSATNWMPPALNISKKDNVVGIIAPDNGARRRARYFMECLYPRAWLYTCSKVRDQRTGALSGYCMPPLTGEGRYIVVDDICDGGGTFNLLAEEFTKDPRSKNSSLELFVSHGIFSKGLSAISSVYTHITTTDSWCSYDRVINGDPSQSRLTVLPLSPLYNRIMGVS